MAILGLISFMLAGAVVLTILRGLVFQALWAWFITPTFGLAELTLVEALGVALIVTFLTMSLDNDDPDNDSRSAGEKALAGMLIGLYFYGVIFAMGATIHAFA